MVIIPLTDLTPPHFCAGLKQGPEFATSHIMVFCVQWVQLRLEVIVRSVDICGNYDHRCFKFLFINWFIILNTSRSFPHSRLITGVVAILARRVLLVEQELPTLPGHLSSPPVYSGVRVTQSLVFVDHY